MATSVIINVPEDHLWQCKCPNNNWHFRDERCPVCKQRYKCERQKALTKLGMTTKKQEKKKKNDKSKLKKCLRCEGTFDASYCPHCGIELVEVTIIQVALARPSLEEDSYAP